VVLDLGAVGRVTSFTLRDPDRLIIDVLGKETLTTNAPAEPPPAPVVSPASVTGPAPTPASAPANAPATAPSPAPAITSAEPPKPSPKSAPTGKKVAETKANPKEDAAKTDSKADAKAEPKADPKTNPKTDAKTTSAATATVAENTVIVPAKASNAGTRSLIRSLGLKLSRVVIDAGHGGHDSGTIGPGGYAEKELVLDVANRLKTLIETEMGAEVVMTRSDDTFIPLESRTAIANQQESDLFISIHANSSRVKTVHGVETYYLGFTSSREALEIASTENAASEKSIHALQDIVKKIMLADKADESRELARHIERALAVRKGSGVDRGIKQAPFVVLIGANMPSILAEICFISNPQDEKSARTPEGRQAIADSLFEGVKSYAESLSGTKAAKVQEKTN
jgi:N-acetylmuramoyl-L-alanine amidase